MALLGNSFVCLSDTNSTQFDGSFKEIVKEFVPGWICTLEYIPWLWAIFGSILVGLSGVLPLLVIPIDQTDNLKQGGVVRIDNMHFLGGRHRSTSGLLLLTGLIVFVTAEKLFTVIEKIVEKNAVTTPENNNTKGLKPQEFKKSAVILFPYNNETFTIHFILEARSSWILPFTAGTFLHIALVTVLPDLLKEEDPKESFKQLLALIFGIILMATITNAFE
nr:zinc transporter ZIP13 homolog [Leptinotarsa decemlineata]